MLWMLCRCTLVLFIIGSLYRSISGSSGGGRFFKTRLHIRTNLSVSIWGSKLGVQLFYKNVLFNHSLSDLYYYTILCFLCTAVNPGVINDHPKCEDLVVVAYKKLLPRDPFQEEVQIHPLFDIEFVAFKFQVYYCVVPCCQWKFFVYTEWRSTGTQLTKRTHHYLSSGHLQEFEQL